MTRRPGMATGLEPLRASAEQQTSMAAPAAACASPAMRSCTPKAIGVATLTAATSTPSMTTYRVMERGMEASSTRRGPDWMARKSQVGYQASASRPSAADISC